MLRVAGPVLLSLLLLSACGGESSPEAAAPSTASPSASSPAAAPSPTGPAALTKADYLAKSEAVCTEALADVKAQPAPAGPEAFEAALQASVDIADAATTELEELAAPQPDAAELQRIFLAPLRQQVTTLEAYVPTVAAALAAGGEQALDALPDPGLVEADIAAMTAYGFESCVELGATE